MAEMPSSAAPFAGGKATTKRNRARGAIVVGLESSLLHLLHQASQCADDIFQRENGWRALTPRQYAILLTVSQNDGPSQQHLVEKTRIDRSTLSEIVRRMETKGLLHRRRTKEDFRADKITLTEKGWRVLEAADLLARRVDRRVLAALPGDRQREQFIQDLNTLVGVLTNGAP